MNKLKMWDQHSSWQEAEKAWEAQAEKAELTTPLKKLKTLPDMPGMTAETAKNLKWKSLKWMVVQDHDRKIIKHILKDPLRYAWRYFKSIFKKKSFSRSGDFFLYGVKSLEEFEALLQNPDHLFVLGFSYCHKPLECPSGRFTDECIHDLAHPVCQQCFIGKSVHACPLKNSVPLFIPTVHYIGGKIFDLIKEHPDKQIVFLITACEMTLEMFGDWGNMVNIRGVGVRLGGRICNTMKAFELSEQGIKPGLTVVLDGTQKKMLEFLRKRREAVL